MSQGPTRDSRIKPDLVVPAEWVVGARAGTALNLSSDQLLTEQGTSQVRRVLFSSLCPSGFVPLALFSLSSLVSSLSLSLSPVCLSPSDGLCLASAF